MSLPGDCSRGLPRVDEDWCLSSPSVAHSWRARWGTWTGRWAMAFRGSTHAWALRPIRSSYWGSRWGIWKTVNDSSSYGIANTLVRHFNKEAKVTRQLGMIVWTKTTVCRVIVINCITSLWWRRNLVQDPWVAALISHFSSNWHRSGVLLIDGCFPQLENQSGLCGRD